MPVELYSRDKEELYVHTSSVRHEWKPGEIAVLLNFNCWQANIENMKFTGKAIQIETCIENVVHVFTRQTKTSPNLFGKYLHCIITTSPQQEMRKRRRTRHKQTMQ